MKHLEKCLAYSNDVTHKVAQKYLAYRKDSLKLIIIVIIIIIMIANITPTLKSYLKFRVIFGFFRTFKNINYSHINITNIYENNS